MGLDMSIYARSNDSDLEDEILYWRKCNQIRKWFVDHVEGIDNCEQVEITKTDLISLLDDVNKVLEDNSLAEKILPTQSGFFFGSTEYDEFYFSDLERTKTELIRIIDDVGLWETCTVYYFESW
jgi:hypothetical protein